jgi:hypothetical protein
MVDFISKHSPVPQESTAGIGLPQVLLALKQGGTNTATRKVPLFIVTCLAIIRK